LAVAASGFKILKKLIQRIIAGRGINPSAFAEPIREFPFNNFEIGCVKAMEINFTPQFSSSVVDLGFGVAIEVLGNTTEPEPYAIWFFGRLSHGTTL